jgi:hypothetical protein
MPEEVTVAFIPVPANNLTAFTRNPELIDDQTLDDALRAPGVLSSREEIAEKLRNLVAMRAQLMRGPNLWWNGSFSPGAPLSADLRLVAADLAT